MTDRRTDRTTLTIAAVIYAALSAWMAVASRGFLEADGITHYLSRRFALAQPVHFVDVWSRPLCVLLYCVPSAVFGLVGTRLESLALVLLTVPLLIACGRRLGLGRPAWAGLLLLTQPLLFAHSFSELTEVPFALLLLAIFYAYQRRSFGLMSLLVAVSPLGRPEGFGLIAVAAVALLVHRKWYWIGLLPLGILVWEWAGWELFGRPHQYSWWKWLANNWPYSPESVYGHGSVAWLTLVLPAVVGPIAFGLLPFGVARLVAGGTLRRLTSNHTARCRALAVVIPMGLLAGHSVLWATGKMASNGEPRYLLVVAPFWAILSTAGLEALTARFGWRRPLALVLVNATLAIAANFAYPCFPLGPQDDDRLADQANAWVDAHAGLRGRYPRLIAWLPHLFMQLDIDKAGPMAGETSKTGILQTTPGTLLMWDSIYSLYNSDAAFCVPRAMIDAAGWRAVAHFDQHGHALWIYESPQDRDGRESDASANDPTPHETLMRLPASGMARSG